MVGNVTCIFLNKFDWFDILQVGSGYREEIAQTILLYVKPFINKCSIFDCNYHASR